MYDIFGVLSPEGAPSTGTVRCMVSVARAVMCDSEDHQCRHPQKEGGMRGENKLDNCGSFLGAVDSR